jgi:hypothetical protein
MQRQAPRMISFVVRRSLATRVWLETHPHVVELAALAVVVTLVGWKVVPAHWTSIWMDREFTGWVAPIAARFVEGQVLYTDGAHSPMPPLPAVLLRLLSPRPRWLHESAVNWLFQGLTIISVYLALWRDLPRPAAVTAALAVVPNFYSLPKTVAYDAIAQFFVAVVCWQVVSHLRLAARSPLPWSRTVRPLLVVGAATGACLLTKQSTGVGVLVGVGASLLLARAPDWRHKLGALATYGVVTAIAVAALLLAMSPWLSVRGLVEDVVLTGAEPKGSPTALQDRVRTFGAMIFQGLFGAGLASPALVVVGLAIPVALALSREQQPPAAGWRRGSLGAAGASVAAFAATGAALLVLRPRYPESGLELSLLLAVLVAILGHLLNLKQPRWRAHDALFAATCIAVPAALAHNLSVWFLRWTYDNNPLVVVALAVLASALMAFRPSEELGDERPALRAAFAVFLLTGLSSSRLVEQWLAVSACRVPWPEVHHLRGARLPESATQVRKLVARVRELTPAAGDDVLLLPEDPNVQSWFDRPRPRLQCAIWFTDQCWDRYVDQDFQTLADRPPKVIVIGPRGYWRSFSRMFNVDRGVERLIDRIDRELLGARYTRTDQHAITFQGRREHMDVYLRK